MHLLMRAQPVGAEEGIVGTAVNGECPAFVIEADNVLFLEIIG